MGRPRERGGSAAPPDRQAGDAALRWGRTAALGTALILLNSYWIANSEMRTGVTELTVSSLFLGVLFLLLLLVGANALAARAFPQAALKPQELLAIYAMLTMSSAVAGVGAVGFLTPFLGNVTWYADSRNQWDRFQGLLPNWFAPTSPEVLSPFYLGGASVFQARFLRAWALPLLVWGLVFLAALLVTFCLASLLRRQWVESERLPFPTALLPYEMTCRQRTFFGSRALWMGFAFPFVVQSLNSLNSLYPQVPSWPINRLVDYHAWFASTPWSGVDAVLFGIHPAGVGLAFAAPLEMSFSMWLFYLMKKSLNVAGVAMGWRDPDLGWDGDGSGQFPFTAYLAWGAWIVLAVNSLALAYPRVARSLREPRSGGQDAEPLPPRAAAAGLLLGLAALCGFCLLLGAPWWVPVLFFGLYLALMVVLCRVVAEVGPPSISLDWGAPQEIMVGALGSAAFPPGGLATLSALSWFNMDYRAAPMPHQLVALKLGGLARMPLRPLAGLLVLALVVAIPAAMLCSLQMYYANGAATAKVNTWRTETASVPWEVLDNWLRNPRTPNPVVWGAAAAGAAAQTAILGLRSQLAGFPLHPAAFALVSTFSMDAFWADFLAAWTLKGLILRYGGMRIYRQALPFFLGMVLGDFTAGAAWSLVGSLLHLDLYRTFPT